MYLTLGILEFGQGGGGFGSLQQVSKLFENRYILLAGWIHYLAFDLFTGCWMVRDSERLRITPSPYHDDGLIDRLAEALLQVWERLGLPLREKPLAAAERPQPGP